MTRPWKTLATASTPEGALELRQRGDAETLITIGGRVLMNSFARSSEEQLARLGLAHVTSQPAPRVLVGGLGMGFTLRAALDVLPAKAIVVVGELNPVIVEWCRGPLAAATRDAASDPRVRIEIGDVARLIAKSRAESFDAILLDLYEGPNTAHGDHRARARDPLYGTAALAAARAALGRRGVLAIWAEERNDGFIEHFERCGFRVDTRTLPSGPGARRHVVYLGARAR